MTGHKSEKLYFPCNPFDARCSYRLSANQSTLDNLFTIAFYVILVITVIFLMFCIWLIVALIRTKKSFRDHICQVTPLVDIQPLQVHTPSLSHSWDNEELLEYKRQMRAKQAKTKSPIRPKIDSNSTDS
ncbi:unnamed protein product [Bursaphelenchus okinawaensis]|uniref:Uncharacterized protein n=1 Tax=Bursaphelenchus okinawaensis TaxID=465554 RepID=A0A811L7M8_9BILA|nr:unnamed protein product [Bursaphelenchus okinawaensis]CAG9117501.1 unnamed protein product [Bursaphelenchus okinawaensis]